LTVLLCLLARGGLLTFPVERITAPPLETGLSGQRRRRRRRRRAEQPYGLFPVEDWRQDFDLEYVEYFAAVLQIGTPPQRQSVIIDTGSSLTFVACTGCPKSHCNQHDDPNFVPDQSSTFQWEDCATCRSGRKFTCNYSTKQCQFNLRYYDGAGANGRIFSDVLDMGWEQIRLQMGCAQDERGGVITDHADGMMGLAAETKSSLTFQIGEQLGHRSIGYCFQAGGRGTLIFGTFDPKPAGITWTPMKAGKGEPNLYYKSITRSMWIGDTLITDDRRLQDNPFKGSVWDSGSPHMWMPKWMYALTKKSFIAAVPQQYEFHTAGSQHMCWKVDRDVALREFPDFSFGLPDEKRLVLKPLQYLITAKGAGGVLLQCADIFDAGNNHEGLAFGSTNMLDMLIIFDYDNSQMGFMHHDCECFLLEGGGGADCIAPGARGGIQSSALWVPTRAPNHGAPPSAFPAIPPVPERSVPETVAPWPQEPVDAGGPPLKPIDNFMPSDGLKPAPDNNPFMPDPQPPATNNNPFFEPQPAIPSLPETTTNDWVPAPASMPPAPEWVPHPETNPWESRTGASGTHPAFKPPNARANSGDGLWEPIEGAVVEPNPPPAETGPGGEKLEATAEEPEAEAGFVDKIIDAVTNPSPETKKVLTYVIPFVAGLCVGGIICLILRGCRKRGYQRVNSQSEIEDLLPGGVEMGETSLPVDSDDDGGVSNYDETARNLL